MAIAKAVALETNLSPRIKWPNDIPINDKKIVGIFLESKGGVGGELREGIAVDVTEEGALLVRVKQNSLITVHTGDIEYLRLVADDADR